MSLKSKINWLVVLALLVIVFPVLSIVAQDNAKKLTWPDLGGREITIAMTNDYPPYQYYDDNKNTDRLGL